MIFMVFMLIFITGCSGMDLPDLPECESCIEDARTLDLDVNEISDDSYESRLIVAAVSGYDVPFSGRVYLSDKENFSDLIEIEPGSAMGSSDGSDLAVSTWDGGFFVIGRYDSSMLYFFTDSFESRVYGFKEMKLGDGKVLNLQDGVYDPFQDEFIISSLNSGSLITVKDELISELKISENENASPSRMKIIGDRLFVAVQNLNEKWISESGQIAVINLVNRSVKLHELPVRNPVGKIEYNENVDPDHFYIACSGNWQKRDGALLRVDINSMGSEKVLSEKDDGGLLDGDFVDLSIADNGFFYIVFSNNKDGWVNTLLKYDPFIGTVSKVDSGINAFAANPIDFSTLTQKVYYFADSGPETFLRALNTVSGEKEEKKMESGPAAVKIWKRKMDSQMEEKE